MRQSRSFPRARPHPVSGFQTVRVRPIPVPRPVVLVLLTLSLLGGALSLVVVSGASWSGRSGARATAGGKDRPFAWLVPRGYRAGWRRRITSSGGAVLSYPGSFVSVHADPGALSEAVGASTARYEAFLNVTPEQGLEQPYGFAAFRVHHLADEDIDVHLELAAEGLAFNGGRGSCVMDDYRTRAGANRYREIACLVVGRHGGYVVVVAARHREWPRFSSLFHETLDTFELT
jgi:hypothetical protein